MTLVSVVSPFFNEEVLVRQFHEVLSRTLEPLRDAGVEFEFIFVDDGSRDGTLNELNAVAAADPRVRVYSLTRNFGHQIALSAGLDAARGEAIVLMDSDLQHPPKLVPEMIQMWRGGLDVVSAVRKSTEGVAGWKKWSSNGFYALFNLLSETRLVPGVADFVLMSDRVKDVLASMPERHRFLRGMIAWTGFKQGYIPYVANAREAGQSKYTLLRMLKLATDAIFTFSSAPIRMATRLGLAVSLFGLMYLLYIVLRYLFIQDTVPGWSSVVCSILVLGGAQLTCLGLIGEYVARIFEQVKARPVYLFKQQPAESKQASTADHEVPAHAQARD